jgi:hypothetical protein
MSTTNYGRSGGTLDASEHVAKQQPGADGYVNADAYNRTLDAWLKPSGESAKETRELDVA